MTSMNPNQLVESKSDDHIWVTHLACIQQILLPFTWFLSYFQRKTNQGKGLQTSPIQ